jgi:hypothetical protein
MLGLSIVGIAMVCSACGEPSRGDLEHDAYQFVPPHGYVQGFESHIEEGEADNRRVANATIYSPGTPGRRLAAYMEAARGHGWTCVDNGCKKSGVEATFWLGVASPGSTRAMYDDIELSGRWYGVW